MGLFEANKELLGLTKSIEPWILERRRRLHQCPELLYELHETSSVVCETLDSLGVAYQKGVAETGVLATIGNGGSSCIMLRADMDALPIAEAADVEFRSRNEGQMHACGHDCHTAMLLGAAKLLKEREHELPATVKLCFQPAEEGGAGAKRMCDEGVMDDPSVSKVFGLHVWPMIPTGQLTGRPGAFLAAANAFEIRVKGKGGHAAMPHLCVDPVVTAAKIVTSLQSIISREQNALEPAVISFTGIDAESTYNVIPSEVTIRGTVRSLSSDNKDHLKVRLAEAASAMALADRCEAEFVTVEEDYPTTFNDLELWDTVHGFGEKLVGEGNFDLCDPILGGEDFAFYGAYAPSCMVALGCGNESKGCTYGLHHPQFKVDEDALHIGTALHLAFVSEHVGVHWRH
ncbi:MAG: amidohydrolase [Acidobacteriota bacterium]